MRFVKVFALSTLIGLSTEYQEEIVRGNSATVDVSFKVLW